MVFIGAVSIIDNTTDSSFYDTGINSTIGNSNTNNSGGSSGNSSNSNSNSNSNSIINHGNEAQLRGLLTNVSATTNAGPTSAIPLSVGIQIEEIIIVFLIVLFWVMAVAAFRRKWDSIRIMQPMEPRYKHIPKGLDSVKVVKRAQDSVIYKSYSRKMSTTMVARENRHLQRTLTMPCMNTLPSFHEAMEASGGTGPVATGATAPATGSKRLKQTLPTIHMEEVTTEM